MKSWHALAHAVAVAVAVAACANKPAPKPIPPPLDPANVPASIDQIANEVLADTGVPCASIAAVRGGKIIYVHAYGDARLEPKTPATPQMRYSIGSISKQFTAAAILLLAEDGKLTLDDPVGKYVPGLTRGDQITIRQILTHTSGYRDYAPQDYMIPEWEKPISSDAILARWAHQPLDFEPGTQYQYSNTNYVIAGVICEKVSGQSLYDFVATRILDKLHMASATNTDLAALTATDAQGYFRRAGGTPHPAPHEGPGWMFAAGELAMTAEDLAKWNISVIDQTVLAPASYRALESDTPLANTIGTHYGLGIAVSLLNGDRKLSHGGEVSGFVSSNVVLPDRKIAVSVLTNQDASDAASTIANRVIDLLVLADAPAATSDKQVTQLLDGFARGEVDRALLTANANAYFTPEAIDEYKTAIAAAGERQRVTLERSSARGGMTYHGYKAVYANKTLSLSVYVAPDGKLEQFLID